MLGVERHKATRCAEGNRCVWRHEAAQGAEIYGVCRPVLRREGKVSSGITTVSRSIHRY